MVLIFSFLPGMVINIVSQMILAFFLLEKVLASYFFGLLELDVARWGFGQ